jgi:hypothetical protein
MVTYLFRRLSSDQRSTATRTDRRSRGGCSAVRTTSVPDDIVYSTNNCHTSFVTKIVWFRYRRSDLGEFDGANRWTISSVLVPPTGSPFRPFRTRRGRRRHLSVDERMVVRSAVAVSSTSARPSRHRVRATALRTAHEPRRARPSVPNRSVRVADRERPRSSARESDGTAFWRVADRVLV